MKKLKIEDFNLFSDELYLQAIVSLQLDEFKRDGQMLEEVGSSRNNQSLGLSVQEKEQLLEILEGLGEANCNIGFWKNAPCFKGDEPIVFNNEYTARKILLLINQVDSLIDNFQNLSADFLQKEYRLMIQTLVEMLTPINLVSYSLIHFRILRKRIQGHVAVNKRHEVKHKIFFDILLKRVENNGKWNSVSIAVQDVKDEVLEKFEEIDKQYIEKQIKEVEEQINILIIKENDLKQTLESIQARKNLNIQSKVMDETLNETEERLNELDEELHHLKIQITKYIDAKNGRYPFTGLGRELLFNTDDIESSLINCLRNNKEIRDQVIVERANTKSKE
ncbi:hypothetical protein BEN71_03730 [Acinetobacter wuhouensis]|uniref:hypothetical protein n=1 Tax=Acinetobacter wuhouensis TaxID=1879050 RepID=UPI00083B6A0D|nr:hypothetical protein [Acinetobacter wuhouensis]AXQ21253.1 hypothetical protein BEN71_03730 [Acinetobacter wuhouensis]